MASYGAIEQAIRTIEETLDQAQNDGDLNGKNVSILKYRAKLLMEDISRFWEGI